MRTNYITKKLASYIILLALSLFVSCSNESLIDNVPSTENSIREGVPMVLNLSIENGGSTTTRSTDYKWEDGATLAINPKEDLVEKGYFLYAVYKADIGWMVYNLNGNEAEGQCDVYYSESWTYETVQTWAYEFAQTGRGNTAAYSGIYASRWYDRDWGNYIKEESTCSYKDGIFYLNTTLVPLYGRVRFVADSPITAEYNHARVEVIEPSDGDWISAFAAATDNLAFHKESDGKYYSNYIYSDAIPEIRIGDYVYKYRGNTLLERGTSGCISLPTVPYTTANWTCEKYFEIVLDTEKTIELNGDGIRYFQLYTQLSSKNTGGEDAEGSKGRGNNIIHSSIGLNVEIDFTVHSRSSSWFSAFIESQNSNDYSTTFQSSRYYEGCASYVINVPLSIRQQLKIHNCYTSEADWFCPYVRATSSDSFIKACVVNLTIHKTKLSNF